MSASAKVFLEKSEVGGQTKIELDVTKVEETIDNKAIKIPIPVVSQTSQNSSVPQTKYKDLKRLTHVYTVEGYIREQTSIIKGVSQKITASQAKNALIYYILYTFGDLTLYWRGVAKSNADPSSTLANLMETTDTNRSDTVVFDKINFSDAPAVRKDFIYTILNGFDLNETNAEKYGFSITLTRGVTF